MSQIAPENEYGVPDAVKNRQLAIVSALVFIIPLVLLALAVYVSTYMPRASGGSQTAEIQTASRIQKVGKVDVQSAAAPASSGPKSAQEAYTSTCAACHDAGVAGAPKLGDSGEWAPRIAQGEATLFKHAIEGFTGAKGTMPPKGGSSLSDDEIKATVVYMANKGGANFAEIKPAAGSAPASAASAATAAPAAAVAETKPVAASAAVAAAAPAAGNAGEALYKQSCQVCHATGVAGAPKLADKADWSPRIAQGEATLFKHAIEGFTGAKGVMPPKGTAMSASDDDIKAAVKYMVAASK